MTTLCHNPVQDEQLNADIGDEDWGVPVRPRRIHDFREEPSAFLEDEEDTWIRHCEAAPNMLVPEMDIK